jgi:hypothetical protein
MTSGGPAPISFSTFVISLASSGLSHLGVREPGGPERPIDLHLAQQTMDLLTILAEKTKGNLEDDEARLLDAVRQDLAQRYRDAAGKAAR